MRVKDLFLANYVITFGYVIDINFDSAIKASAHSRSECKTVLCDFNVYTAKYGYI